MVKIIPVSVLLPLGAFLECIHVSKILSFATLDMFLRL